MIEENMAVGGHNWKKLNIVNKLSTKGIYDIYKCINCGLEVRSYKLGYVQVRDSQLKKLYQCPKKPKYTKIKIKRCFGYGPQFVNLTPGSVHDIVISPEPESQKRGEWVMGVDEKVLVLFNEFDYVEE